MAKPIEEHLDFAELAKRSLEARLPLRRQVRPWHGVYFCTKLQSKAFEGSGNASSFCSVLISSIAV